MGKQIQVDDADIPSLIEYYQKRKDAVKTQLSNIDSILRQLLSINTSNSASQLPMAELDGYPIKGLWIERIRFILNQIEKGTAATIINEIIKYEPERAERKKALTPTISGLLGTEANNNGAFKRQLNERGEYEYQINN